MGREELSTTRVRNQKRRQGRQGRNITGKHYELGGAVVKKANDKQVAGTHYKDMGVQVWDVVDSWPLEQRIGYYRGNALKYVMRCGNKDEATQELKKAIHYLEKLVELLEEQNG